MIGLRPFGLGQAFFSFMPYHIWRAVLEDMKLLVGCLPLSSGALPIVWWRLWWMLVCWITHWWLVSHFPVSFSWKPGWKLSAQQHNRALGERGDPLHGGWFLSKLIISRPLGNFNLGLALDCRLSLEQREPSACQDTGFSYLIKNDFMDIKQLSVCITFIQWN